MLLLHPFGQKPSELANEQEKFAISTLIGNNPKEPHVIIFMVQVMIFVENIESTSDIASWGPIVVVYIRILVASFMRFCDLVMCDVVKESSGVCPDFSVQLIRRLHS